MVGLARPVPRSLCSCNGLPLLNEESPNKVSGRRPVTLVVPTVISPPPKQPGLAARRCPDFGRPQQKVRTASRPLPLFDLHLTLCLARGFSWGVVRHSLSESDAASCRRRPRNDKTRYVPRYLRDRRYSTVIASAAEWRRSQPGTPCGAFRRCFSNTRATVVASAAQGDEIINPFARRQVGEHLAQGIARATASPGRCGALLRGRFAGSVFAPGLRGPIALQLFA